MKSPLNGRAGLRVEAPENDALARELGRLATRHGLRGAVLITFTADDRIAVNSSGSPDLFARAMEWLGDSILSAIDDGKFDPPPHLHD